MSRAKDLINQKFGRLKVLRKEYTKNGYAYWMCLCACGKTKIIRGSHLTQNDIQSCGCFAKETTISNRTIHGQRRTRLYRIWTNMKSRCKNPNASMYEIYGGRGISVCDEWEQFEAFFKWAMDNGYNDTLSIDRIDVDGDYEPNNCRWATQEEQGNNTRSNRTITYKGRTQTLKQWAKELGINYKTLFSRYSRGWNIERMMTIN